MRLKSATILSAIFSIALGTQVHAQDTKTLKFAHILPANHWGYTESFKVFSDEVTKATDGRITFQPYHAGQLGKEGSTILESGLAETATIIPSYESAKVPLSTVAELPGFHIGSCEGTAKLWHLIQPGGPLHEAEYTPKGIHVLYAIVGPAFHVMTNKKEVKTMDDVKGLIIRANGAAMSKTVSLLGGSPAAASSNELYDALSRGTMDGAFWPIGSTRTVGLEKVLHYAVGGGKLGGAALVWAMRQDAWDALSDEEKQMFTTAGAHAQHHLCKYLDDLEASETKILIEKFGLKLNTLSEAEAERWNKAISPVATDWAKEMDSTGRPGSELLEAYRNASAKM